MLTAEEDKLITEKIKARQQGYRDRYPDVHGKTVDWVHHSIEDGTLYVMIRFDDETQFALMFDDAGITHTGSDLDDCHNGDLKLIRGYGPRKRKPERL